MLCHVRGIFAMAAPDARGGYHVVAVDTSEIDTLKAAKQHVKLVDEGAGGRWKVDRHAPGDGVTRAGFVCNNHVSCPVKLLIRRNDGMYCFLLQSPGRGRRWIEGRAVQHRWRTSDTGADRGAHGPKCELGQLQHLQREPVQCNRPRE